MESAIENYIFKVWNLHRTNKRMVIIPSSTQNLYEELILKASFKLQIDGSTLVLESDGTIIDEDELLKIYQKEIFILLEKNEIWFSVQEKKTLDEQNQSLPSTDTVLSTSNEIFVVIPPTNMEEPREEQTENTLQNINIIVNPVETTNVNENTWRSFEIPWEKLPQNILDMLNEGNRNKSMLTQIVRMVVDEMRVIKKDISEHSIRIIAHKMLQKYPQSFQDVDDDGEVLGDGSHTLFEKLKERKNYLNQLLKRKLTQNSPTLNKKKRKRSASKAGCSNWDPVLEDPAIVQDETSETELTIEDKIKKINDLMNLDDPVDETYLFSLLEDTYATQRSYVNQDDPPIISDIIKNWPALLHQKVIFWHYNKLVGHDIRKLEESIKMKSQKIIQFGKTKKLITSNTETLENETEITFQVIKIIISYFKEDFEIFFKEISNDGQIEEVKTTSPCIIKTDDGTFHTVIEKSKINKGSARFFDILNEYFAVFYNFNLSYPKKLSATLEFFQRYFLKIHPDAGTKSTTYSTSKKKVINLMKLLSLY